MKIIRCDRHPERDAVATFKITKLVTGCRPILIGASVGDHRVIDLCEECTGRVDFVRTGNVSDDGEGGKDDVANADGAGTDDERNTDDYFATRSREAGLGTIKE